ncbi:MAG: amidase [Leptolyngbyaceae cyanobacterium]
MTDLVFLPAHQLAQMIRDRTLSSVELVDACLAQIARHNSSLNAVCTLDEDNARTAARQADEALANGAIWGALHGVPITIKDFFETKDLRTTAGYQPLQDYVPKQDATIVNRLRSAGAILLGKTNPSDVNGAYQGINDIFPRVNNPWNVDYTPGGSSSGSAAAIAAGFSALDVGSDIAGSIRQPAHFCGIYGLKPTDRRVSLAGHILEIPGMPECIRQMLVPGPLARSVEDLRLCFRLIAGVDPRQPDVPPIATEYAASKPLTGLRIAWSDNFRVPVAAAIQTAFHKVVNKLAESGAIVENWAPQDIDWFAVQVLYNRLAAYNFRYAQPLTWDAIRKTLTIVWREATQGEKSLRQLGNPSQIAKEIFSLTLRGYFEALTERDRITAKLDQALAAWDVWLTPVAATPAFTHRPDWSAVEVDGRAYPHSAANGAYTMPFNLSGHPAIVIPIDQTQEGLPIGIQLVGKRWREMELLAIAQTLDAAIGAYQAPSGY